MIKTEPCQSCNGTGEQINNHSLARELRARRLGKGISLQKVAETMGITISYLSDLEHGRRHWRTDRIRQFEKAVGK